VFHQHLQLVCVLKVDCFLLVVGACVFEDLCDVAFKLPDERVTSVGDLLFNFLSHGFQVHRILDIVVVVWHFGDVDWFAEWPRVFVLAQLRQYFVALVFEAALVVLATLFLHFFGPACFLQAWNILKAEYPLRCGKTQARLYSNNRSLCYHGQQLLLLEPDIPIECAMSHVPMYSTLHHGTTVVVFNVPLPPSFRHVVGGCLISVRRLGKALLFEVLDGVVVGIRQEIVELVLFGVILQPVHQPSAIPFDLL